MPRVVVDTELHEPVKVRNVFGQDVPALLTVARRKPVRIPGRWLKAHRSDLPSHVLDTDLGHAPVIDQLRRKGIHELDLTRLTNTI